jgi:hypothetical protein
MAFGGSVGPTGVLDGSTSSRTSAWKRSSTIRAATRRAG